MDNTSTKVKALTNEIITLTNQMVQLNPQEKKKQRNKIRDRERLIQALQTITKNQIRKHQNKYPSANRSEATVFFKLPSNKIINQLTAIYKLNPYPKKAEKILMKPTTTIRINSSPSSPLENVSYSSWQNGKFSDNGTKAIYSRKGIDTAEDREKKQKLNKIIGKPITLEGYQSFEKELSLLKSNGLLRVKNMFENAETSFEKNEARLEAEKLNTRINDLETLLAVSIVVEHKRIKNKSKVMIGHKITVLDIEDSTEYRYLLGGPTESNIEMNTISSNSPIGIALLGKKINQKISYDSPDGIVHLLIKKIE